MRWSSMFAAVLLAAGCVLILQPSAHSANTDDASGWTTEVAAAEPLAASAFEALRSKLGPDDPIAVLEAVGYALDQVGDGATYVWHRMDGPLQGAVKPTASFRDESGAVCRRLGVTLTLGEVSRWANVVACRDAGGQWAIGG